jgi:hypothetical protein
MSIRPPNWPPNDIVRDVIDLRRRTRHLETQANGSAWYDYDPVWSSSGTTPTLGSAGPTIGHYQRIASTCITVIDVTFAGDTAFGTGTYTWSLPFTSHAAYGFVGVAHINTSGGTRYGGQAAISASDTFSLFFPTSGSPHTLSGQTNTVPVTLASGDRLRIEVAYRVAEGS